TSQTEQSQKLLLSFYHCSTESVLTYCLCVWYAICKEKIIGCPLPSLDELYTSRCLKKKRVIPSGTNHTQDITCLNCCPLAEDTGQRKQTDEKFGTILM
ncbi:hypothetical protein L3Q82_010527, partial [Scortum barcoo]